ncbi:MAG TPA: hypothetical protein VM100_03750 [Longimicrobiales bacterium]|nr:hypothetical protein [Longimicrobiales bacterium]
MAIVGPRGGASMEHEQGPTGCEPDDLDILPSASDAHAGPKCFVESFFGREASGEKGRGIFVREAVATLRSSKQSAEATLTMALEKARETVDGDEIEAGADDH